MKRILIILLILCSYMSVFGTDVSIQATNEGRLRVWHETVYTTARDDAANVDLVTTTLQVGQTNAANYYLYRTFASFVLPAMTSVSSVSLFLEGVTNSSGADFEIYVFTSTCTDPLETGDWGEFDGNQASGVYNGTVLNINWNSVSYSDGWNEIVFNTAGIAAVLAAQNTTFKIALISKEDYSNDPPGEDEFIVFSSSDEEDEEPYLAITYNDPAYTNSAITVSSNLWGSVTDASYATARDTDLSESGGTTYMAVGQRGASSTFQVMRSFFIFAIPAATDISACTFSLNGGTNESDVEFDFMLFTAPTALPTLADEDYSHFSGRQTAGAHDGTNIIDGYNSASFSGDWNVFNLNADGLAAILAAQGGNIALCLISSEDYINSSPGATDNEYITFDALDDVGLEPHLDIIYSALTGYAGTACGINNPANVCGVPKANLANFIGVE